MGALPCLGILCLVFGSSLGSPEPTPIAILDQILLAKNYDKRVLPHGDDEYHTRFSVGVNMYILDVESLDIFNMDMTVSMYFRQFWNDPRLTFKQRPGVSKVTGGLELVDRIWLPDTFFVNKRELDSSNTFVRILHTGDVLWSQLIKVKFACPMDLHHFPFDSQLCTLDIESFSHTMDDYKYHWNDGFNSVLINPDLSLPQFVVMGYRQRNIELSLIHGNYSRLSADIQLTRASGHNTLAIFVIISVLVMTTWISFWINPAYPAARLALLVPPLIMILGVIGGVHLVLTPSISYATALLIYAYISLFMILLAFIPFVLVTVLNGFFKEKYEAKNKRRWTHPVFITDTICKVSFPIISILTQYYFFKYHMNHDNTVKDLDLGEGA